MRTPRSSVWWLGAALALSGAAGLVFEALWFRLAGLLLGNSVWATTIVLASFMAGLALGSGWAADRLNRFRDPIRTYAAVEIVIGVSGVALVFLLPALNCPLAPLLAPFLDRPLALNVLRGASAFALLVLPATAMGVTLPVAVKALAARDANFGRVLGRLYGLNTLGGVAGVLACEFVIVPALGLRLAGVTAGLLNLAAASCALRLRDTAVGDPAASEPTPTGALPHRLLAAAALCGAALLAQEVVWFRFLLLFMFGSSAHFAVMLATVLLGIAGGGLAASLWLARRPDDHRLAAPVACAAGASSVLAYLAFIGAADSARSDALPRVAVVSLMLMLPTSLFSGALFTLLGRAVQSRAPDAAHATARVTLANTLGAMAGAFAGGLVLVPWLGAEASLFVLAAAYGVVALLCWPERAPGQVRPAWPALAALGTLAALLVAFPFGRMSGRLLELVRRNAEPDLVLVAAREGRSETIQYTRRDLFGRPMYFRLLTNGISMSGTNFTGQRYMGLYVYWPMALRPRAQSALLLSYGVGVTARALVETRGLRSIDVVDVSPEILSLSAIPFGAAGDPLRDPRVRVHVEDARFFLQSTSRTFDLITGEPPPPKAAGIVTLYSREYFALLRSRLAPNGLTTYWLPVQQLEPREARAIVAAFCQVFEDCTLWTGAGPEWMLAGSRGGGPAPSVEAFAAQWSEPVVESRLEDVALESPDDLSGLFLGDAAFLAEYARGVPPLTDDHPHRLGSRVSLALDPDFVSTMEARPTLERFLASGWVVRSWPEAMRRNAAVAFRDQRVVTDHLLAAARPGWRPDFAVLHRVLSGTTQQTTPRLLLGVAADAERIAVDAAARGMRDPDLDYLLGVRALSTRDYAEAAHRFGARLQAAPRDGRTARCLILSLLLIPDRAGAVAAGRDLRALEPGDRAFWSWFDRALVG